MATKTKIDLIKERLEKATPGPWRVQCTPKGPCGQMVYADAVLGPVKYPTSDPAKFVDVEQSIIWTDQRAVPRWRETLGFIANAPTDIALLLTLVDEYKRALEVYADPEEWTIDSIENGFNKHGYERLARQALERGEQLIYGRKE